MSEPNDERYFTIVLDIKALNDFGKCILKISGLVLALFTAVGLWLWGILS